MKITYDQAVEEFASVGYMLLEKEYINAHKLMSYMCPKHPHENLHISRTNLLAGKRCKLCRREETAERLRIPYNEVKMEFEKREFILLVTEEKYKNSSDRLRYQCPRHPNKNTSATLNDIRTKKYVCRYCAKLKVDYEDVKKAFSDRNCQLLENQYINDKTNMRYICLLHPEKVLMIKYDKFRSGHTACEYCTNRFHATYEEVKKAFSDRGYVLLETEYKNVKKNLKFFCPKHPDKDLHISYSKLKSGQGCRHCGDEVAASKTRKSYEEVKEAFAKRGYELLEDTYQSNSTAMKYRCPAHTDKDVKISYSDLVNGEKGCPYCFNSDYTGEGHVAWKGGVTLLSDNLRGALSEWKKEILQKYNYTCAVSGEKGVVLHVHHPKSFAVIRDEAIKECNLDKRKRRCDYSQSEIELLTNYIIEKHKEIQGIPMKKKIHTLFHSVYGKKRTTIEDFWEFKTRYLSGEFSNNNK